MNLSRRDFIAISSLGVAGLALPRFARAALIAGEPAPQAAAGSPFFFKWDEVSQGVFATTPADGQITMGGNAAVVHGKDGAILIDTKFTAIAKTLRRDAEGLGLPLRYVVNTHHHADHTGGNWAFTGEKMIKVAAHNNAKARIEAQFDRYKQGIDGTAALVAKLESSQKDRVLQDAEAAKKAMSNFTIESFAPRLLVESLNLDFPGSPIELHHTGPGHTDNDLWIFLPHSNVLHTGDLLFNGLHPYIDAGTGATTRGWQKSIADMQRMCNEQTVVIPGHGPMTDAAALKAQSDYFSTLRDFVAKARKEGKSRDDVLKLTPAEVPGFEKLGFEQMFRNALGVVFDELEKE